MASRKKICVNCQNDLKGAELTVGPITRCFKCSNLKDDRDRISDAEQIEPLKTILSEIKKNSHIVFVSENILTPGNQHSFLIELCAVLKEDLLVITYGGYMTILEYNHYDILHNSHKENPIKEILYNRAPSFRNEISKFGINLLMHFQCQHPGFTLRRVKLAEQVKSITIVPLMLNKEFSISEYNKTEVEERQLYEKLKRKYK